MTAPPPVAPPVVPIAPNPTPVTTSNRRACSDRRLADRRVVDHGSPYGTERRSGRDDRQGDRRGAAVVTAGIGLTRDYFSQVSERVTTSETGLEDGELIRFDD